MSTHYSQSVNQSVQHHNTHSVFVCASWAGSLNTTNTIGFSILFTVIRKLHLNMLWMSHISRFSFLLLLFRAIRPLVCVSVRLYVCVWQYARLHIDVHVFVFVCECVPVCMFIYLFVWICLHFICYWSLRRLLIVTVHIHIHSNISLCELLATTRSDCRRE